MSQISVINADALLPGDIVLSTSKKNKISWMIRVATASEYSHAALHVGHGIAVEANDPGVVPVYLPSVGYDANTKVHVRRVEGLTPEQQTDLVSFVWSLLYRPYSTRGAVSTVLSWLRKEADPGYFCSQLASAAYESIKHRISACASRDCKPSDLAASNRLIDIPEAVHSVDKEVHEATTNLMADAYNQFLEDGNKGERSLLKLFAEHLPKDFAAPFNIYDLVRQFYDGTVDVDTIGKTSDAAVGSTIKRFASERPLTPCPGISVATSMAASDKWMPVVFTDQWKMLTKDRTAFEYHKRFITQLFTASNWEVKHWQNEHDRLVEKAKNLQSQSLEALALWISFALAIKYQYSMILKNSQEPGTIPREVVEKCKATLKAMQERHYSWKDE
jgi:hypothetical protein